ncbi:MAG: tetratricopeptide repeat protein [Anaerolineae bacterium]|nr:tetratricopeptide repeat protein [Anaerolineae bacterium]
MKLHFLGPPRIEQAGRAVDFDTRKAPALLAYLAVTGEPQPRETLATLLWAETDDEHARGSLRRTLSALRRVFAEDDLRIDREVIALGEGVWSDIAEFRRLAVPGADAQALARAVHLHRDDFLRGFSLRDSPPFDDWQFAQAEQLRRELGDALERLVGVLAAQGSPAKALPHARRWLALDGLHEPAHRAVMLLLAQSGDRNGALQQYRECARVLENELGVQPLEETVQLHERIRADKFEPRAAAPATPSGPLPGEVTPLELGAARAIVLVGRKGQWQTLQRAREKSGLISLEGEAGIGKTHLARAYLASAREAGTVVLEARCFEGEASLAYAPLAEALRRGLDQPGLAARLDALAPHWLAEAARLLPELARRADPRLDESPVTPAAQGRFFEGVLATLSTLLGAGGVFFLDDAHFADEATLELLSYIARRLRGRPMTLMLAWRTEDAHAERALRRMLAEAVREGMATQIALRRLSAQDVEDWVRKALPAQAAGAAGLARQLHRESEGVPLFIAEALALMAVDAAPAEAPAPLQQRVRELLRARLNRIADGHRQVLEAAAVIGRSFDLELLRWVSGRSDAETAAGMEALLAAGALVEARAEEGSRFDFSHEKLRDLARAELGFARRRLLHIRSAAALIKRGRARGQSDALAGQIAQHLFEAGRETEAAGRYAQAGDYARRLYANAEALSHYQRALALGHPEAGRLHERIGDLRTLLGDYSGAIAAFEIAAGQAPDSGAKAALERKLGDVCQRRGDWAAAEAHLRAALELAQARADAAAQSRILADWSLNDHRRGDDARAARQARRALKLAEAAGDASASGQAHNILGMLATHAGQARAARSHLIRSLGLAEVLRDPFARIAALNNLALSEGEAGEHDQAIAHVEQALALCAAIGDRHHEAALRNNLADLFRASGRRPEALAQLKQAVTIFAEIGVDAGQWQPEIWKLAAW